MGKRVFFRKAAEMRSEFKKIINSDPPMAKELLFYEFLASFAGKETNAGHLVIVVTLALSNIGSGYPINLSRHIEALTDDIDTINKAKGILEGATMRLKEKNNTGLIVQA